LFDLLADGVSGRFSGRQFIAPDAFHVTNLLMTSMELGS
jgi:hypothetical protein